MKGRGFFRPPLQIQEWLVGICRLWTILQSKMWCNMGVRRPFCDPNEDTLIGRLPGDRNFPKMGADYPWKLGIPEEEWTFRTSLPSEGLVLKTDAAHDKSGSCGCNNLPFIVWLVFLHSRASLIPLFHFMCFAFNPWIFLTILSQNCFVGYSDCTLSSTGS